MLLTHYFFGEGIVFMCLFFITNQLYTVIKGISSFFFRSFIKNTLVLGLEAIAIPYYKNVFALF